MNKMENLLAIAASMWAMPAVKALIILIIGRITPNKWLFNGAYGIGVVASAGGTKFFKSIGLGWLWNKIEDLIENSIAAVWNGFRAGLNSDDSSKVDEMRSMTDDV